LKKFGALLVLGFGAHAVLTGASKSAIWSRSNVDRVSINDPVSRLHQLNNLFKPDGPLANACLKF